MAAQDDSDSLDVLQDMFNEALIHTGKALRASRQEVLGQTLSAVPLKLPDTLTNYHDALDNIENEILQAKAILGRDLERLRNKDTNIAPPEPVEAQTKSPMVIDVDSSPIQLKAEPTELNGATETKPVAPFPDMGMDIPAAAASADFGDSALAAPMPDMGEMQPAATMATEPPTQSEEVKQEDPMASDTKVDAPSETFTNMEFTLAPADTDASANTGNQDQPFDMANFTTNDAGDGTIDLNTLLPPSTEQGNTDSLAAADFGASAQSQNEGAANSTNEASFDTFDLDNMDWGGADGSDFNFDINDDGTFNDLMKSHDNMTDMEHGQFDADFFGLSNEGA